MEEIWMNMSTVFMKEHCLGCNVGCLASWIIEYTSRIVFCFIFAAKRGREEDQRICKKDSKV